MPKISVVIPCYNVEEKILLRCVKSVLEQVFQDYEIIIIDDGSKEEYRAVFTMIKELDSRIQLLVQENAGVSAARNAGVKCAQGEYIVFVDADDVLLSNFLSEAYSIATANQVDFLIGGNASLENYISENRESITNSDIRSFTGEACKELKPYMVGEVLKFGELGGYIGRGPWTRLVKRGYAINTPFDVRLSIGEDIVWNLQLIDKCKNVCVVYQIWYLYYHNSSSATQRYNDKAVDNAVLQLSCIKANLNMDNDNEYQAYCKCISATLKGIFNCYLGRKECTLSRMQRRRLLNKLYHEEPWSKVGELRYFRITNRKNKVESLLYRYKLLFCFWKIKSYFKAIH